MVKGIYHSAAGMIAGQRRLEVVANNLANANTTGFKEEKVAFRSRLNAMPLPGSPVTQGEKFVVAERGVYGSDQAGTLEATGNAMHLAIVGSGFFVVETPHGLAYTRDGRFQLNSEGELVTMNGNRVLAEGGAVQIPEGNIRFGPDGSLVYEGENSQLDRIIDRIRVVTFDDPTSLRPVNNGLLVSQQVPRELTEFRIESGYLEESNVNMVEQMIELIQINKIYEASANAIKTQDATLGKAVNEVGRNR